MTLRAIPQPNRDPFLLMPKNGLRYLVLALFFMIQEKSVSNKSLLLRLVWHGYTTGTSKTKKKFFFYYE